MRIGVLRHIIDVIEVSYNWTSGLRYSPPRLQDNPEYVAVAITLTVMNGLTVQSSLILVSPHDKGEAVPIDGVSWLADPAGAQTSEYAEFSRFRRALMDETDRRFGSSRTRTLQSTFDASRADPRFEAEVKRFYESALWKAQNERPQLLKLPELGWCILFEKALWQALPGVGSGDAILFLEKLSARCGTDISRDLLKKLVDEPFNHEFFLSSITTPKPELKRKGLSEDVRHEVWRRDQGRCMSCGSAEKLEFDHIIPHSRGGSDTARNIQLLCEACNRKKSAKL